MINRLFIATFFLLLALIPIVGWQPADQWFIATNKITQDHRLTNAFRLNETVFPGETKGLDARVLPEPLHLTTDASSLALKKTVDGKKIDNSTKPDSSSQTPARLWRNWQTRLNRSEYQQIPIINALLAEGLRQRPDPAVYQSISELLATPDEPIENKALALDLLAEIATPDALTQLLAVAGQETDSPLYFLALQAISRIGENRWDGAFHEELSPVLEASWSNSENNDPAFLSAIGSAIADVGAPEGVNLLLLTLSASRKDTEKEETERIKQEAAFEVIPEVRNPNAVAVLGDWLNLEPLGTPAFEVSGDALAEIGTPEATQEIVSWGKSASAEAARNFEDWLGKIDEPSSLAALSTTQDVAFKSVEISNVFNRFAAGTRPLK